MVYRAIYGRWPPTMLGMAVDALSLHDVQFSLCEWDKYERYRLKQGKVRKHGERTCIFTNFQHRSDCKKKARAGYAAANPGEKCSRGPSGLRGLSRPATTRGRGTDAEMTLASAPGPGAIASSGRSQPPDVLSESDAEMSVAQVVRAAQRGRLV